MPVKTPTPNSSEYLPAGAQTPSANNPITKPATTTTPTASTTSASTTSAVSIPTATGQYNASMYQNIDQSVYDAVKGIVGYKGQYNDAKYVNGSNDYSNYQTSASSLYEQLRAAGRSDIADFLENSDYTTSVNYLQSIGVPVTTSASDGIMDNINNAISNGSGSQINTEQYINDYNNLAGSVNNALNTPDYNVGGVYNDASNFINAGSGSQVDTGKYINESTDLLTQLNNILNQPSYNIDGAYNDLLALINGGSGAKIDTDKYTSDFENLVNILNGSVTKPDNNTNGIYNDASDFINAGSNSAIDTGKFVSDADALANILNNAANSNANFNQSQESYMQTLNDLLGEYMNNDGATQGRIDDLWASMNQYGTDQSGRYDNAADYLMNTNYLDTPAGQAIMGMYDQRGSDAARNAAANASSGGSIDSYAAANANRQNLDFMNAGNEAALNQWNTNYNNLLSTYGMLGNDMNNLQQNQLGLIGQEQNYNLGTQGNILNSMNANNQLNANMNSSNVDAIANILNTLGGMYNTQSTNASADYAAGIGGYNNMYGNAVNADAANYSSNVQGVIDLLNNLTSVNNTNAQTASADYAAGIGGLSNAHGNMLAADASNYAQTANSLNNALNNFTNLNMNNSNNASADYAAGVQGYTGMYGDTLTADSANYAQTANALNNALNNLTTVNTTNSDNATADFQNILNTLGGAYGKASDTELGKYQSDNTLAGQKYESDNTLTGNLDKQQKDYDVSMAENTTTGLKNYLEAFVGLDENKSNQIIQFIQSKGLLDVEKERTNQTQITADGSVAAAQAKANSGSGSNSANSSSTDDSEYTTDLQEFTDMYNALRSTGIPMTGNQPVSHEYAVELIASMYPDSANDIRKNWGTAAQTEFDRNRKQQNSGTIIGVPTGTEIPNIN